MLCRALLFWEQQTEDFSPRDVRGEWEKWFPEGAILAEVGESFDLQRCYFHLIPNDVPS